MNNNLKEDIGFVLIRIENNPFYNIIFDTIQTFIKNNPYNQCVIFNSFCEKIDTSNIPILHLNQAKFFHGNLLVFDFISILLTRNFPNIKNLYYYAQDLPWESEPKVSYNELSKILIDTNINIIAKNQYIYEIYDICWKQPIGISEKFDYESLKKIL